MTIFQVSGKIINFLSSRKCIREAYLTAYRFKDSNFLGYYRRHLRGDVFAKRKEEYRKNVLKPLEEIPTLEERLKELNAPDPILDAKVDIGFAYSPHKSGDVKDRLLRRKHLASLKTLPVKEGELYKIDISKIQEDWQKSTGPLHIKQIAEHYGIFSDLYEHGTFTPCVPLNISYNYDEETVTPVYMGNILQASEASGSPNVSFPSGQNDLWTLVLTNLDGHLLDTNSEYLHWFIGNIKAGDLKSGDVICDYLQPFPMRGSGYHRLVFVLYKQQGKVDYSSLKKSNPCLSLSERTFKTFDFYKEYQDLITPAGLAFFQSIWDESLTDFFHHVLNMQEPVFEYIQPPIYYRPQVHFPHKEPFNLYLDRYRDPKEIKKEVLLKRLNMIHPFKDEPAMPKYPMLHKSDNYKFSWQKQDIRLERLRLGKYRDLRPHSVYPQEDNQFPYWTKA